MSKEAIQKALSGDHENHKNESVCLNPALPTLPTLPASKTGALDGNVTTKTHVTDVTEWPDLEKRPCWRCYGDWIEVGEGDKKRKYKPGVWYHGIEQDGDNLVETNTWVCTPLFVDGITSDGSGMEWGRLLRIKNRFNTFTEWAMPMTMLGGSFEDGRRELLRMGLEYCPHNRARLPDYLFSQHPKRKVIAVNRTGWVHSKDKNLFVMPDCLFGDGDVVFQSEQAGQGDYASAGSLDDWKKQIGELCRNNPVLQFAVCAALAGPLLHLLHKTNGGVHYIGDSSCGKTTALNIACSIWGKPDQFIKTWRATGNGLEGIAALRNDTILVLDEIGEANPHEIGGIVYAMGNGTGKQRANVRGNARAVNKWRLFLLSSGERTLTAIMSEAGKRSTAGQQVRLLDIPVNRAFGVFDDLHHCKGGRELSDQIKTACERYYGHVGKAFLRSLVRDDPAQLGGDLEAIKLCFETETSNQEGRGADRFAVVALAGELAISYELLPWEKGDAINAAVVLFNVWRKHRGKGNTEDKQILSLVRAFVERYGDSRFTNLYQAAESHNGDSERSNRLSGADRAGYWIETNDERQYRFNRAGLEEATKGHDINRVKQALVSAGWLSSDIAKQVKTPEGNKRLYPPLQIKEVD